MLEVTRGAVVRLWTNPPFRNLAGTPTDPTTVTVKVTAPDAATTSYTLAGGQVIKDTTRYPSGDFYYDLATAGLADSKLGRWVFTWIGTGDPEAADKNVFLLVSDVLP